MKPKHILIRDAIGNLIAEEKSKTNDYIALTGPFQHQNTTQSHGNQQNINAYYRKLTAIITKTFLIQAYLSFLLIDNF